MNPNLVRRAPPQAHVSGTPKPVRIHLTYPLLMLIIYDRPQKGTQILSVVLGISHPLVHQSSTTLAAIMTSMSVMLA
jgi:hypothetical protein